MLTLSLDDAVWIAQHCPTGKKNRWALKRLLLLQVREAIIRIKYRIEPTQNDTFSSIDFSTLYIKEAMVFLREVIEDKYLLNKILSSDVGYIYRTIKFDRYRIQNAVATPADSAEQ